MRPGCRLRRIPPGRHTGDCGPATRDSVLQKSYVEPQELYRMVSDWKRRTIENSLYGVDINPEAVEICRLRLWLSMVLDMDEPPDPLPTGRSQTWTSRL